MKVILRYILLGICALVVVVMVKLGICDILLAELARDRNDHAHFREFLESGLGLIQHAIYITFGTIFVFTDKRFNAMFEEDSKDEKRVEQSSNEMAE